MSERLKAFLLAVLKVPPVGEPPSGHGSSARVFRAARNFYVLNLTKWGVTQAAAVVGILVALSMGWERQFEPELARMFRWFEYLGLAAWVLQTPVTWLMVRLDYEMRWYIVTDRSLRIRYGIVTVREMTMTFANIQQIAIGQGPLQRMLGIADLQVRTAGGGGSSSREAGGQGGEGDSMHLGYFRGVDNAEAIRDLIIDRLRRYRDAGLGDPDDVAEAPTEERSGVEVLLESARGLATEARLLREAVERSKVA